MNLNNPYNRTDFVRFLERDFLPDDFIPMEEPLAINEFKTQFCKEAVKLGSSKSLGLDVFEITHTSSHDARVGISKDAFQILLRKSYNNRALVLFVPEGSKQYRFSLIQIEAELNDQTLRINRSYSNPRRYSFLLGEGAQLKTPNQFLLEKGKLKPKDGDYFPDLLDRFSVEVLTKEFYRELSNWYFWAIQKVSFPNDINDDSDDSKYNSENTIRLITRLIFVWFLKQKELVAGDLFDKEALKTILKDFEPESDKQTNYYRAILQNLFFATLNQEVDKRAFAPDRGYLENRVTTGIKNLYRYENEFQGDTTQIMQLFSRIPFLNGGLFECLDGKEKDGKIFYWDGFSRSAKRQAKIPNHLFFAKEQVVDLSQEYNDTRMRAVKVSGIIEILSKYNFTVEENTPVEIQVALDPELLGKVFENLLGAFNPETKETARKQTGSFYTPREIVNYMVNESLIAYYRTKVPDVEEETLRNLFSYEDKTWELKQTDKEKLVQATFEAKILDPACGSGAFPMGILQQMVHVLKKLDPENVYWNKVVLAQAESEFLKAEKLNDDEKADMVAEIESTFEKSLVYPDYARKLHLIENCIYGVDIQSIAVQISKLRFFISLICEQGRSDNPADNFGIRPLPNLETKFVAANTLIGISKNEEDMAYIQDDHIKQLIDRLTQIRHRQFMVTNATRKKELRQKDEELRVEIVNEVEKLYKQHADEHLSRYRMQLKVAELELKTLENAPDDIRSTTATDLFGNASTTTYNHTANRKKELKAQIKLLNEKISMGSDYSRLNAVVKLAKQLTSWNPYDQNKHSEFFDPEWMFGFKEGFDVVIGNPPYVTYKGKQKIKISSEEIEQIIRLYPNSAEYKINSYALFIEKGLSLLHENGIISYIIPSTILQNEYLKNIRKFIITNYHIMQIVGFTNKVFEAVTDSIIFTLSKNRLVKSNTIAIRKSDLDFSILQDIKYYDQEIWNNESNAYVVNLKTNNIENLILDKIELNSDFIDNYLEVYVGIVANGIKKFLTNLNVDNNHKKYLQGKHIDNFEIKPAKLYINFIIDELHSNTDENVYLQAEKILVRKTGNRLIAALDNMQYYTDQSIYNLYPKKGKSINLKIILAQLNSKLLEYYFNKKMITNPDVFPYIKGIHLKRLPIKLPRNRNTEYIIESLVDKITENKKQKDIDKLNSIIFKLYDLTYDEVQVVEEGKFWLSEEEYAAITL